MNHIVGTRRAREGCYVARDARGGEYAGWDTCLPTTSGCWGARITLDLVERARHGGAT